MTNLRQAVAAVALLAATVPALAQAPVDRTREYRVWSAERMVERVAERLAVTKTICGKFSGLPGAETCKADVIRAYPMLKDILTLAAFVDDVEWAKLVDAVHAFEDGNEAALNSLKQISR